VRPKPPCAAYLGEAVHEPAIGQTDGQIPPRRDDSVGAPLSPFWPRSSWRAGSRPRLQAGRSVSLAGATVFVPTRSAARVLRSELTDLGSARGRRSCRRSVLWARPMRTPAFSIPPIPKHGAGSADPANGRHLAPWPIWCWPGKRPCRARSGSSRRRAAGRPGQSGRCHLAGPRLFDLIQAVETEECDFAGLDDVVSADLQQWWQLTAEFLKIAREYWPALLEEIHRSSPARHHNAMIDVFTRSLPHLLKTARSSLPDRPAPGPRPPG
jgi:hypothetical protein